MSAFVGIISFGTPLVEADLAAFERMMERITYRGIDGVGQYTNPQVLLGHRLFKSTFESENEQQPHTLGHVTIVADAILYNRDELLSKLQAQFPSLKASAPDVELIAAGYHVWGQAIVEHLMGCFVFALWDAQQQRLLLVEDQFGMREVHYAILGDIIIFSTEISAIRLHPLVSSTLSEIAVLDFLMFHGTANFDKSLTVFADIKRIEPGHLLSIGPDHRRIERYWKLDETIPTLFYKRESDYVDHLDELLKKATRAVLRGPEMVLALSGGLDSPTIAAYSEAVINNDNLPISLQYVTTVVEQKHPDQERFYAQLVAHHMGKTTALFVADPYRFQPELVGIEPAAFLYTEREAYDQLRFTRGFGKLLLTGRGGDEVFRRSTAYDAFARISFFDFALLFVKSWYYGKKRPPFSGFGDAIRKRFRGKSGNPITYAFPDWIHNHVMAEHSGQDRWHAFFAAKVASEHPVQSNVSITTQRFRYSAPSEFLQPLPFTPYEVLQPYLHLDLVHFTLSLPMQGLLDRKYILRKSAAAKLPEIIIERRKSTTGNVLRSFIESGTELWSHQIKLHPMTEAFVDPARLFPLALDEPRRFHAQLSVLMLDYWMHRIYHASG